MNEPLPPLTDYSWDLPIVWDNTMLMSFRKCPRSFFNSYMQHLRSDAVAIPLLFGGTFAKGLEIYRKSYYAHSGNPEIAFERAYSAMITAWGDNPSHIGKEDEKRTFDRCAHALLEYFRNWPVATDLLQPHMSNNVPTFEYSFAVVLEPEMGFPLHPSGAPFILAGRLDLLGTYDSLPIIEDDKTTTMMGPKWIDQWTTRHQFLLYGWALRHLGFKARHYMVRGICIRKEETAFEQTPPLRLQDYLLDKIGHEMKGTLADAVMMAEHKTFERRFGDACYSFFRQCPFWNSCSARPENEMSFLKTLPRNKWDPLKVVEVEDA